MTSLIGCPSCEDTENQRGLFSSFWAQLDNKGEVKSHNFSNFESETGLGAERQCLVCNHTYYEDEAKDIEVKNVNSKT